MTTRKRLEGALADWHPHPKGNHPPENNSLVPVVRDAGAPDEIADRFFDSAPALTTPEPPVAVEPEPRRVAIDSAAVRARRRYLTRYVAGAVSIAGIIGLAALVRVTLARDANAAPPSRATSAIAASLPAAAPAEPAPPPADPMIAANAVALPAVPVDLPAAANPSGAAEPTVAANAPVAADPPATADPPVASTATAESLPPDSQAADEAKEARKDAQRALDRGRVAESIEAGEQSVAIDPTDADAWLILGAAYQKQGHYSDARRCFTSCAAKARRGARWECSALLR
jgi:TPR repeat